MRRSEMIEKIIEAISCHVAPYSDFGPVSGVDTFAEAALKCVEDAVNDLQFQQTLIVEPGKYKNNKPVGSPVTKTETKIVWTPEEE